MQKMLALALTDDEIEWLYSLVAEQDAILRPLKAYPTYTTIHNLKRKLDMLVAEINEENERARDKYEDMKGDFML